MSNVAVLVSSPGYTFTEAFRRLGVSGHTFTKYVRQGKIQRQAEGYCREDVERMVQVREARQMRVQCPMPPDVCTVQEARKLLKIAVQSFYQYVSDGKLTAASSPGPEKWYYKADIERLISKRAAHDEWVRGKVSEEFYTFAQTCEALGVAEPTLRQWAQQGKLQRVMLPQRAHAVYQKVQVDALAATMHAQQAARVHGHPDEWAYQLLYTSVFARANDENGGKSSRLVRYLMLISGWSVEDLQDVVQRVFLKLWEDGASFFEDFPDLASQRRLVFRRCRQEVLMEVQARRVRRRTLYQAGVENILVHHRYPSVEHEVVARERWEVVVRHLQQYPVKRRVIAQMMAQGFTTDEIVAYLREHEMALSKPMVTSYRTQMAAAMRQAVTTWDEAHKAE